MAMGHYYECPFCGEDYKDMKCVNEKCPGIAHRKAGKELKKLREEQLSFDLNDKRNDE